MERSELKLNDFEGFERFLFTDEERKKSEKNRYRKYMVMAPERLFIPPIKTPKTIEEYQLCHYVYWMCISIFNPRRKLKFVSEDFCVLCHCYPCQYIRGDCKNCPVINPNRSRIICGEEYIDWVNTADIFIFRHRKHARKVATMTWRRNGYDTV